ncbi:MAG: hypothetical protein HN396_10330 [Gemmatimonadales bacterium]|jgi:hypothetical protein|nr:hypothetical protein [Gemmatimonadales bacterium]MBT3497473.1 hypothetical protein [Gemmatimonadales bacterium]MBT3775115.1 hypothetical protein [Gemmatimonadales bacterium]MBT3958371.1 hypothetical protein [Gemmatimonadales bacterium]MBT4188579.1 hypothetical protein [Gemmatimonadales bacterium]
MLPYAPSSNQPTFIHRFSAALNTHFHFHAVVLNGVFSRSDTGEVRFHEAAQLTPEHWAELQYVLQRRVLLTGLPPVSWTARSHFGTSLT